MNTSQRFLVAAALSVLTFVSACSSNEVPEASPAKVRHSSSAREAAAPALAPSSMVFPSHRANYTVANVHGALTVTSASSGLVTPVPYDTARLVFSDGTLALDIDGNAGRLYRLYQAAFDRVPDSGGLAYWLASADRGTSMDSIATDFTRSAEFVAMFGAAPTNGNLLTLYYQHVLHRAPDAGGYAWWLDNLDRGAVNSVSALLLFSESPENQAQLAPSIKNGIWLPGPAKMTASIAGLGPTIAVGQLVPIDVQGVPLALVSIKVDANTATGAFTDGRILFAMPDVAAGSHAITVSASGQTVSIPITVVKTVLPAAPKAYLTSTIVKLDAELAALEAGAKAGDLLAIQKIRADLLKQIVTISAGSDSALEEAARIFAANLSASAGVAPAASSSRSAFTASACMAAADAYPATFSRAIMATGLVVAGFTAPPPTNLVLGGLGVAVMFVAVHKAEQQVLTIIQECLSPFEVAMVTAAPAGTVNVRLERGGGARMLAAGTPTLPFNHNKVQSFVLHEKFVISSEVADSLGTLAGRLASMLSFANRMGGFAGLDLKPQIDTFSAYAREQSRVGLPSNYALGTVSSSAIVGTATPATQLGLSFAFKPGEMTGAPVAFTFTLLKKSDNTVAGTYSAVLNPISRPTAEAVSITVPPNTTVSGTLKGAGADKYEIVTQPVKGTLTVVSAELGQFTYRLGSGAAGDDSFTYRAVNEAGVSAVATVTLKTDMQAIFEAAVVGDWTVTNYDTDPDSIYTLTVLAGGKGYYRTGGKDYAVTWKITKGANGAYTFKEVGFWHPAYDAGYIDGLTYPVTYHYTGYATPALDPAQRVRLYTRN